MNLDYSDHSFGIAQGCCKVSPGCAHCYAEEDATRFGIKVNGLPVWGQDAPRRTNSDKYWEKPHEWNADARFWIPEEHGGKAHPIVFCSPLCDVFEDHPTINQEREKLWDLIQATPNLDWHLVTKRAENIERNLPWGKNDAPWPNVWISVSVENDYWARKRLPYLASLNVAVRGAHLEPLLGPIPTLAKYTDALDWVLVGGESRDSDPEKARAMQPVWVKEIKKICEASDVPFFFKQWGSQKPVGKNPDGTIRFEAMNRWKAGNVFLKKTWHTWPTPKVGKPRCVKTQVVHCMKEPCDVYIGRKNDKAGLPESMWHNPFFGDDAVERFRAYIENRPELLTALPEVKGKILGCWCKGTSRPSCHGDVLAEMADRQGGK